MLLKSARPVAALAVAVLMLSTAFVSPVAAVEPTSDDLNQDSTSAATTTTETPAPPVGVLAVPENTASPTISGNIRTGWQQVASPGSWTGSPASFGYQWQRCIDSTPASCGDIAGATFSNYVPEAGDFDTWLRVEVTAENIDGVGVAYSMLYGPVVGSPFFTSGPTLSGDGILGAELTVAATANGTQPVGVNYAWYRCDSPSYPGPPFFFPCPQITTGVTTYTVSAADLGKYIYVDVVAGNVYGAANRNTAFVGPVTARPLNAGAPAVTVSSPNSDVASTSDGTWANSPEAISYQWQLCSTSDPASCADIPSANDADFTFRPGDVGQYVRSQVTASNGAGSTTATSDLFGPVAVTAPTVVDASTVSGVRRVGETLTGTPATFAGVTPSSISTRWLRCVAADGPCVELDGAVDATYTLGASDVGTWLAFSTVATSDFGDAGSISTPFGPITAAPSFTATASTVTAGGSVEVSGAGFEPNSEVSFTLYSTPRPVGSTVVAADGSFTFTVVVPADLELGAHRIEAVGRAADGSPLTLEVPVTVTAAPPTPTTVPTTPTPTTVPATPAVPAETRAPAALAVTGAATTGGLGLLGGLGVGVGAALVALGRRRDARR
jgi:hypothetical protein